VRGLGLLLAIAVVLGGCATDLRGTRLALQTETGPRAGACDQATVVTVRITRDGDDLAFIDGAGGPVSIIWPFGFAAWLEYGKAVLYARDGSVVGREGGILDTIDGFADAAGFHVCKVGLRTYS
jgi:hypothetical protein